MNPLLEFREVRCPTCNKLLFKIRGIAEVEILCPRCHAPNNRVLYPDMKSVRLTPVIDYEKSGIMPKIA
ncbi:MAG: Com family DNA-binding transcriptional regulator [Desulfurellales bacterium]|jgi:phage FluMu protein Com|nr:MAG: Com family DNA-binding transcriptional regulator [Desulfurellales bacterium]